jgi:hypothetical protein
LISEVETAKFTESRDCDVLSQQELPTSIDSPSTIEPEEEKTGTIESEGMPSDSMHHLSTTEPSDTDADAEIEKFPLVEIFED